MDAPDSSFVRKKWITNVHSSTLEFVLFSRKLCYLHFIFLYNSFLLSFSVTDFLYRNHYSSLTPFFVRVLIPLPFQYFWKYDSDYSTDDKTRQTSAQFFGRKHFLFFTCWFLRCFAEGRRKRANKASVDCCSVTAAMHHENHLTSNLYTALSWRGIPSQNGILLLDAKIGFLLKYICGFQFLPDASSMRSTLSTETIKETLISNKTEMSRGVRAKLERNNVFERRTSTGSGLFSNFISSRHVKRENTSLPVGVRRSKKSLLKLPNYNNNNLYLLPLAIRITVILQWKIQNTTYYMYISN